LLEPRDRHEIPPDASFDGGDMDCGSGLLLLIRKHIDPLNRGGLLEIRSTEISVDEDLPAWCRLTGNELVSWVRQGRQRSFLVCKGKLAERSRADDRRQSGAIPFATGGPSTARSSERSVQKNAPLPEPAPAAVIAPLSTLSIGSWPRPRWMLQALHDHTEHRLDDSAFQATADDAVRLAVDGQLHAGVDVITDGEQRRDNYSSFVGGILDNCQLIPLTDLLSLVEDPEEFARELRALDVPASEVRHPVAFGPIGRSRPIALHEANFLRSLTSKPVKIALPGPYLLTRTMWMDCIVDRAYASREHLAEDLVRVLREEVAALLAAGVSLVQLDEPVLTEVVFGAPPAASSPAGSDGSPSGGGRRSFMCGALSARLDTASELAFARHLINAVAAGFPRDRLAVHVCRGNWTADESVALSGDYRPLASTLAALQVGTLLLEFATDRAGEMEALKGIGEDVRLGIGVVNQKHARIEPVAEIVARGRRAIDLFGRERVLLCPDCGFATFADNPVTSAEVAQAKLSAIAQAAQRLRESLRA
jgi:5-methyltetrahydropteroyltriglutamate--homocysteine methyltransferase